MVNPFAGEFTRSQYRLLGLVGQGQFGRVYCASHRKTGRLFALKELNKDRFPTRKFLRELRFLVSLQHPNIVTCHALEHIHNRRYLVMDYCEGGTLRSLLDLEVPLHPAVCLNLVQEVLRGLEHAHHHQIIHCDIKPENILLTLHAKGWRARISDFGIAHLSQELPKDESGNTGSPAYMAPERFYGQYSFTADLYAVGILLYELFAGHRPFSGTPAVLMAAHMNQPVKIPETVPAPLHPIILTALQKLQARRYQSATEMLTALKEAIALIQTPDWEEKPLIQLLPLQSRVIDNSIHRQPLRTKVHQIVVTGSSHSPASPLLLVSGNQLIGRTIQKAEQPPFQNLVLRMVEPIRELLVCSRSFYAIAQRSVYRLPQELLQRKASLPPDVSCNHHSKDLKTKSLEMMPDLVAEFEQEFLAAIAPNGSWMATAIVTPAVDPPHFCLWNLQTGATEVVKVKGENRRLFQLIALDNRHLLTLAHLAQSPEHTCINGVLLEVFTRRGDILGRLSLPLPMRRVFPVVSGEQTSGSPGYRLLATEPGHPHSLLLIQLKPLQIRRIPLESEPLQVAIAPWGYVVAGEDGHITLLNKLGERLGGLIAPSIPSAIALANHDNLIIATWQNHQGSLYTLDLSELDLGVIF